MVDRRTEPRGVYSEDEIDLSKVFRVVFRHAWLIFRITAGFAVVAMVVSLLLPKYYKAETRIAPPQEKGGNLAAQLLGGQMGGLIAMAGGAGGVKTQGELYVSMLKSRTVLDRIVDRYDLMKLYDAKFREDARLKLLGLISAKEERKSGIIVLEVEDRSPKRASDVANAFIEELKTLTGGLAISEAGQRRMFYEEQLGQTKASLIRAEDEIRDFQQRTGMIQIDSQARAIIEGIARLRAEISVKEVEAKVLRSFATDRNPDLQRVEEEVRALRFELNKMETTKGSGFDPLMSSGRVPEMGIEYLRKLRQLKYNETVFELLSQQYELAKLDEAKNAVVIQVIDPAVPPDRKSRPRRALIVLAMTMAGLILAVSYVLFTDRSWRTPVNLPGSGPSPENGAG